MNSVGPSGSGAQRDRTGTRPTVLYVAGEGRSGSTLLGRMLHRIDSAVHVGEVVHLWRRGVIDDQRCSCGVKFSACSFWAEVGVQAFGGWDGVGDRMRDLQHRVDRQRFIPLLMSPVVPARYRRAHRAYADGLVALYHAVLRVAAERIVVDTSKHASMAFVLQRASSIDLRVLHLVRDSRGVSNSWTRQVARPEVVDRTALMPRYRPVHAAGRWLSTNLEIEALRAVGARVATIRYEDLVVAPDASIDAALRSLGVDTGYPTAIADGNRLDVQPDHSVSGNPLRFRREPVELRLDEAWRRDLPRVPTRLVTAITWPLLRRYNYTPRPGSDRTVHATGHPALDAVVAESHPATDVARTKARSYGVLPTMRRPRLVIPLWPPRVSASAVRGSSVGSTRRNRAARRVVAAALRTGVPQLVVRDRLELEFETSGIAAVLREATQGRAADVGIRLGTRRPNSKPVLQIMAADGTVVAFAKVGWNALTRRLVTAESAALRGIAPQVAAPLVVPQVLASATSGALDLVVLSPVPTTTAEQHDPHEQLGRVVAQIARLGDGPVMETLGDSRYVVELCQRVDELPADVLHQQLRTILTRIVGAGESTALLFGYSHGDFTPWNTRVGRHGVSVWDWERARDAVPVGFDALQYWLQIAVHRERLAMAAAAERAADRAATWLADADVDRAVVPLLSDLHLIELVVRYLETSHDARTAVVVDWCQATVAYLEERA